MKTVAYERFGQDVSRLNAHDSPEDTNELIRESLNINFEWSVLMEAQHTIDELQIMQEIFAQQLVVIRDFEKALKTMKVNENTMARVATAIRDIDMREKELAKLEEHQRKTWEQVSRRNMVLHPNDANTA